MGEAAHTERGTAFAELYRLLAARLWPDDATWEAVACGDWAAEVARLLDLLALPAAVPPSLWACRRPEAEAEHFQAMVGPGCAVRPVESLFKPWTDDPTAELSFAREKGWLGGDPAAHLRELYLSLGIEIPPELAHAPDHLALELSLMGLLFEFGTAQQREQFRLQHLDWVAELSAEARRRGAPPACQALLTLVAAVVTA